MDVTVARRSLLIALLAAAALTTADTLPALGRGAGVLQFWPGVTLWAWERAEDLRGAGADVGVAFLAATVRLSGTRVDVQPRHQPLDHDAGARVMAVIRIETSRQEPPVLTPALARTLATELARLQQTTRATALQIDFDAATTERAFYAQLIQATRATIGTASSIAPCGRRSSQLSPSHHDASAVIDSGTVPMVARVAWMSCA